MAKSNTNKETRTKSGGSVEQDPTDKADDESQPNNRTVTSEGFAGHVNREQQSNRSPQDLAAHGINEPDYNNPLNTVKIENEAGSSRDIEEQDLAASKKTSFKSNADFDRVKQNRKSIRFTSAEETTSHSAEENIMANEEIKDEMTAVERLDMWRPLSWSSIFIGAIVALAISASLHILGVGITANSIDVNTRGSDALMMVGGVSGVLFLVATAVSLFVGGFVASSLAHTFTNSRATVYGLGVWALTTLVSIAVVGPALINGAGNAINAAGTVADRTARVIGGVGNTATQAAQAAPSGLAERVQRTLIGTTTTPADPAATQEITSLVGQRIYQGSWTPQQRDQLHNAIAKAANIPVDDARRRVDEAQATIDGAMQQVNDGIKRAAEVARVGLAGSAYWAFASMLIGFLAAFFGARYGALDESNLPSFARLSHRRSYSESL